MNALIVLAAIIVLALIAYEIWRRRRPSNNCPPCPMCIAKTCPPCPSMPLEKKKKCPPCPMCILPGQKCPPCPPPEKPFLLLQSTCANFFFVEWSPDDGRFSLNFKNMATHLKVGSQCYAYNIKRAGYPEAPTDFINAMAATKWKITVLSNNNTRAQMVPVEAKWPEAFKKYSGMWQLTGQLCPFGR